MNPLSYGCLKIAPTYAVSYYRPLTSRFNPSVKVPLLNRHAGVISDKSATKIRNAVNWMLLLSEYKYVYSVKEEKRFKFKLNFITLTLPSTQVHTDEFIKEKMLTPFIQWLTKTMGCKMWLWKCEAQDNGNIHIHITTHVFVHWMAVRAKWNRLLAKYKYCKVFQDGTNDRGNAATQVKAAKNGKQVGGYLAGYIGKKDLYKHNDIGVVNDDHVYKDCLNVRCCSLEDGKEYGMKRAIHGRLWACSNNIASISCIYTEYDYDYEYVCTELDSLEVKEKKFDYYTVLLFDLHEMDVYPPKMQSIIYGYRREFELKEIVNIRVDSLFSHI